MTARCNQPIWLISPQRLYNSAGHFAAISLAALNTIICHAAAVSLPRFFTYRRTGHWIDFVTTGPVGRSRRGTRASTMAAKLSSWSRRLAQTNRNAEPAGLALRRLVQACCCCDNWRCAVTAIPYFDPPQD